jgi:hypothetical protein
VIPLARREFDDNHHGLRHTLGEPLSYPLRNLH